MSNKSMVLRECRGGKSCNRCNDEIPISEKYWSGPYKSLCKICYDIEKVENEGSTSSNRDNNYTVSGPCHYGPEAAIGVLWDKRVCFEHINKAITDNV